MSKTEQQWIEAISGWVPPTDTSVLVGIGDDAAVFESRGLNVATTDTLVEGVHFDLSYCLPEEVGHKALAVNLSDIAAMAARPSQALISLVLPAARAESFVPGFYAGLSILARENGVNIIGGNLSRASVTAPMVVSVTLLGETERPVLRSGAKVGDVVFLIGDVGCAAAGLALLRSEGRKAIGGPFKDLVRAQLRPEAQTSAVPLIEAAAHALIDVSDGLASELYHLSEGSRMAFEIDTTHLGLGSDLLSAAQVLGQDPLHWALYGGEDYALLGTAPAEAVAQWRIPGLKTIGTVRQGQGVWIGSTTPRKRLARGGHDHFEAP